MREVARALVVDNGRLLLLHWRDPVTKAEFWEPPGGEREPGETFEAAVAREVREETGLTAIEVGDLVRELRHRFVWRGAEFDCWERYYSCTLVAPDAVPRDLDEIEREGVVEVAWLTLDQIASGRYELEPPELVEMLSEFLAREDRVRPQADDRKMQP